MAGDYDPNVGLLGFQEYQGSPREENIDGEPRFFRTFYGPSANRWTFLNVIFGAVTVFHPGQEDECIRVCTSRDQYPLQNWQCQSPQNPLIFFNVSPEYQLFPVSYRCEAWDSNRANVNGTVTTLGGIGFSPNIECGVLIEVEYRSGFQTWWPDHLHDPTHSSTINTSNSRYEPDVPWLERPTFATIQHEFSIETRTVKGRTMEITSYGTVTPDASAPGKGNQITSDDVEPITGINYHTFTVTLHDVPGVGLWSARRIMGRLNNDVWFGYPAHSVLCYEVAPKPKYMVTNQVHYDIDYTFVAKWVPAYGEAAGMVVPAASGTTGSFVHDDMIGIWNRAWWEHTISGTSQHWWPITEAGESTPTTPESWAQRKLPFEHINFHLGFNWWLNICVDDPVP